MAAYLIDKVFPWQGRVTAKVESVLRMFGLDVDRLAETAAHHKCQIEINPGEIVFLTGPSGSGKSVLLRELMAESREYIDLDSINLSSRRAVIDCIDGSFLEALKTLSIAGLSDVFAVLNTPAHLSEGQKYRFKLAKALSLLSASHEPRVTSHKIIFADEFCSNLDRITAAVIAFQVRKFATRRNISFVLASSHQDILADLQPDILVIRHLTGKTEVHYKNVHDNKTY